MLFRSRNRIVSGLSAGVLVVEMGTMSGAGITARLALEQGKKTFCIPCNIDSKNNKTNELILKGVKPVMDVTTILQDCDICVGVDAYIDPGTCGQVPLQQPQINIAPQYKDIYNILSDGPKNIDEIFKQVKDSVSNITGNLTMMEIEGLIEELPGKTFRIL